MEGLTSVSCYLFSIYFIYSFFYSFLSLIFCISIWFIFSRCFIVKHFNPLLVSFCVYSFHNHSILFVVIMGTTVHILKL